MTTKSTRIKAPAIASRAEFEAQLDIVATWSTKLRQLEAHRDELIQQAQAKYAGQIAEIHEAIKAKATLCEKYAEAHRAELLPGKAKSAETPLARYGFRTGTPQFKTLAKWTWDKVLARLKESGVSECVRVKEEVDKEKLISAARATGSVQVVQAGGKVVNFSLSDLGARVVQAETFFIKPKVEGAETVKAGEAA